jgi:hypothetical protein
MEVEFQDFRGIFCSLFWKKPTDSGNFCALPVIDFFFLSLGGATKFSEEFRAGNILETLGWEQVVHQQIYKDTELRNIGNIRADDGTVFRVRKSLISDFRAKKNQKYQYRSGMYICTHRNSVGLSFITSFKLVNEYHMKEG